MFSRIVVFLRATGAVLLVALSASPVSAQLRAELVASGFAQPLAVVPDPLTPGALIVVEQQGLAWVVLNGVKQATPFLDIRSSVKSQTEQGFLGLAFSPDGSRVFVSFSTPRAPDLGIADTVVARFRRSADPLVLDPASRFDFQWPDGKRVITQPSAVHKGGNLVFGPDGYLYVGLGDGGGGADSINNAQNPMLLIGKFLRLDVNVADTHVRGYQAPPDNPFIDGDPIGALHEIWAFGYRNPWRFSFDDVGAGATGAMIVGDVGEGSREEIDYEPAGRGARNYGWFMREGTIETPGVSPFREPAYLPLTEPLVDYPRSIGRSVTGGFVYRGSALPSIYRGRYFVADFFGGIYSVGLAIDGNGEARLANVLDHTAELRIPNSSGALVPAFLVPTFGRDLNGELYFTTFTGGPSCPQPCGRVFKIVPDLTAVPAPPANLSALIDASTVTLGWQPGSGGGPTFGYRLEAGSTSGSSDILVAEQLEAGLVVGGVPPGLYFVRIRAMNAAGLSAPSNEVVVRVGCGGPPLAPTGLSFQVADGGVVTLTWTPTGESTNHVVEAGSGPGLTNIASFAVGGSPMTAVAPPGTYHVRIRGITSCGLTPPTNEVVVVVP
jgi:glucose/arabinose dehydrogenase